jgi:hypothetical protein
MYDVVILTLEESVCGDTCEGSCARPRTQVLHCADELRAAGARVETVTAHDDAEVDAVLARLDAPPREDGLTWPDPDSKLRVVVAVAEDSQLRHVVRRMVRRYAAAPSKRPAELPSDRTVPDLPAVGVLPLAPGGFVAALGLPSQPGDVARALLTGQVRRLDLLRHDGGSVVIDGTLLGATDEHGQPVPWRGRVEVDDTVLTDGDDDLYACVVAVSGRYARLDGMELVATSDPADGLVEVGIAVPSVQKRLLKPNRFRVEVRRARGRAVSVMPRAEAGETLPYVEDGVPGELSRKRSWWTERRAWAVYTHAS